MWQQLLGDARLYELLYRVDVDVAEEVKGRRCRACGGPLHVANYPRKPRGEALPAALAERYEARLSFCCGREGCRLRTTPPSVRFLGRRVYLATVVVLVTAARHGEARARGLARGLPGVLISRRTLARWVAWWRETFPMTTCWGTLRGLFLQRR